MRKGCREDAERMQRGRRKNGKRPQRGCDDDTDPEMMQEVCRKGAETSQRRCRKDQEKVQRRPTRVGREKMPRIKRSSEKVFNWIVGTGRV